jgi:hypothetical protein
MTHMPNVVISIHIYPGLSKPAHRCSNFRFKEINRGKCTENCIAKSMYRKLDRGNLCVGNFIEEFMYRELHSGVDVLDLT